MRTIQSGVLLKKINYSETSLILHFFTLEDGFQAYIFRGGKKKKGTILQPLSLIEITSYHKKNDTLKKITEVNSLFVPQNLFFHPIKSGLSFFMTEVLSQVLYDVNADNNMFSFLEHEIRWIDDSNQLTNYPMWFLFKLAEQVGIGVQVEHPNGAFFNFQEGLISNQTPTSSFYVNDDVVPTVAELLTSSKTKFLAQHIDKTKRNQIINHLLHYFQFHINGFKEPKSIAIMKTIFN